MADIVAQVAKYLAEKTGKGYGSVVFYYQMPDSVDECVVVQRNRSNVSVPVQIEKIPCIDCQGKENHVVLMHIEPSMAVHANQADEAFLRVGDKSK